MFSDSLKFGMSTISSLLLNITFRFQALFTKYLVPSPIICYSLYGFLLTIVVLCFGTLGTAGFPYTTPLN